MGQAKGTGLVATSDKDVRPSRKGENSVKCGKYLRIDAHAFKLGIKATDGSWTYESQSSPVLNL